MPINYNNHAEVIIELIQVLDNVITMYEATILADPATLSEEERSVIDSLTKEQRETFNTLYEFALAFKPEIASMSHGERVNMLGFFNGASFALGFSFSGH